MPAVFSGRIVVFMKLNGAKCATFSLDAENLQLIDQTRAELERRNPGMRAGRSDALRVLLRRARDASPDGPKAA